jgi:hypothetical protein
MRFARFYNFLLSDGKFFKEVDVDGVAEQSVHSACENGGCVVSKAGSASFLEMCRPANTTSLWREVRPEKE